MKASSLYLALHLAPLVWSAPAALPQVLRVEPDNAAAASGKRWRGLPRTAPEVVAFGGDVDNIIFHNRPIRPTKSDQGSRVLVVEQPLTTEHLLSIHPDKTDGNGARKHHHDSEPPAQRRLDIEVDDAFEISDMDISIAIPTSSRLRSPCRYARLSRERNDVLVVILAVAFLLAVLLMESWASVCHNIGWMLNRQGAIRLEEEIENLHQPLSIQASEMKNNEKLGSQAERF